MMNHRKRYVVLVLLGLSAAGCNKDESASEAKSSQTLRRDNVLLITLDTTRADRLGCYGFDKAITPALDALAARGTLFEQAFSQVNLTLPSHCSIMTGRYPRELGVHVNGRNALGTAHPTLAEIFKQHGYDTAAFVASFVLDSKFGLDRGFDLYEDDMGASTFQVQSLEWQITANQVANRALTWLDTKKRRPFFCWVHFFDPHAPYSPPGKYIQEGSHEYNGELTFVDDHVKRLTDWLAANELTDQTLVIVVGDHGESFGEHGEFGHTNFIYETNLHVPYILAHPNIIPVARRVNEVVEVVDLFPTVLELFGWELPKTLSSRSLVAAFAGEPLESKPSYAESQYVFNSYGWAEQRSLTTLRWKYISSTKPELYDRKADPEETTNLIDEQPEIAQNLLNALTSIYKELTPGEGGIATLDPQTTKALESIGYTGSGSESNEFLTSDLADPKDMLNVIAKYQEAMEIFKKGQTLQEKSLAIPRLEEIVTESPKSVMFRVVLGKSYMILNQPALAIQQFRASLELDNTCIQALMAMGNAMLSINNIAQAIRHYELVLRLDEYNYDANINLAGLILRMGKQDKAIRYYRKVIKHWPSIAKPHALLSKALLDKKDYTGAIRYLQEAVRLNPDHKYNQYNLAALLISTGQFEQSIAQLSENIRLQPDHGYTLVNLAGVFFKEGKTKEAKELLRQSMEIEEVASLAHYYEGMILIKEGKRHEAISHYEVAIQMNPIFEQPVIELVSLYLSDQQYRSAVDVLKGAANNIPYSVSIVSTLANLLSTCQESQIRNGQLAVKYGLQASTLTGHRNSSVLGILASAYAETSDFNQALEICSKAIEYAGTDQTELVKSLRTQLEGYRKGQAHRIVRY